MRVAWRRFYRPPVVLDDRRCEEARRMRRMRHKRGCAHKNSTIIYDYARLASIGHDWARFPPSLRPSRGIRRRGKRRRTGGWLEGFIATLPFFAIWKGVWAKCWFDRFDGAWLDKAEMRSWEEWNNKTNLDEQDVRIPSPSGHPVPESSLPGWLKGSSQR